MNKDTILSIVRHLLTFGGGFAAAKFNLAAGDIEAVVASLLALVGVVWGVVEKRNRPPTV